MPYRFFATKLNDAKRKDQTTKTPKGNNLNNKKTYSKRRNKENAQLKITRKKRFMRETKKTTQSVQNSVFFWKEKQFCRRF